MRSQILQGRWFFAPQAAACAGEGQAVRKQRTRVAMGKAALIMVSSGGDGRVEAGLRDSPRDRSPMKATFLGRGAKEIGMIG
jgi:hypothetical protein